MKTILIIEDDSDIRMTLKELLESEGHKVQLAENGQMAIEHLLKQDVLPDLMLLDLYMPVMGGAAFLSEIRAHFPILSGIPIFVMTAASAGEYPENFDQTCIIKKPIDVDELITKIENPPF